MLQSLLLAPAVVLLSLLIQSPGGSASTSANVPCVSPVLANALAELRGKTRVPLRLPGVLGDADDAALYAEVGSSGLARYAVRVGQYCERSYCPYGTVSGVKLQKRALRPRGARVTLAGGVTGYFRDGSKSLENSVITWDEGPYRYTIKVYAAGESTMLRVANSALSCDNR